MSVTCDNAWKQLGRKSPEGYGITFIPNLMVQPPFSFTILGCGNEEHQLLIKYAGEGLDEDLAPDTNIITEHSTVLPLLFHLKPV
ncbi:Hypothetical predicted protein [Podarcis lilfordi]|uniref:Uncharacterized protein n=1 Tax=Podarcis lilfordi TaxID=74358 RepID=A0AA35KB83_9SAUR|nr:Hypothetical predicted protein [Podarcis lilfordi]